MQVTRARARVYHLLPEFASHQWHDDYFDNHVQSANMVVVFDHDSMLWAENLAGTMTFFSVVASLAVYLWLCFGVLPDRFIESTWNFSIMLSVGTLGMILFGGCCFMRAFVFELTVRARLPPAPHTALTTQGVWHVTGGGFWSHQGEHHRR